MNCNSIKIFTTGGTFDKVYNKMDGTLGFEGTCVEQILHDANMYAIPAINITELMTVDSLFMNELQREVIAAACENEECNNIVIIHGTDSIKETAALIANKYMAKTVLLVGAMRPYSFRETDAHTNMIAAISICLLLPIGVYVYGGGVIFPHNNIRKNQELSKFEPIDPIRWSEWYATLCNSMSI